MMVAKLIDALTTHPVKRLLIVPGAEGIKAEVVDKIRKAEKFDFGDLNLEYSGSFMKDGTPRYAVPRLTSEEEDFLDQGLVPLPAPLVWYEFSLGGHGSGLLVEDGWRVLRVDFDRDQGTGAFDGVWISRSATKSFIVNGPQDYLSKIYDNEQASSLFDSGMAHGANWSLARYFTLMINSRTSHVEYVSGKKPDGVVPTDPKRREPRHEHRKVTIIPREYFAQARAKGEDVRTPPKLHWRRSHLRHFEERTATSVWKSDELYRGVTGWWVVVIPRQIIGRAENGSIEHTYYVPQLEAARQ